MVDMSAHTDLDLKNLIATRTKLLGSPLLFTQVFYKLRTGRSFDISDPIGREPHMISMFRELVKVFIGEIQFLYINIPPRYGKTECLIHFVAWAMARYPDSNFIYTSYAKSVATKQTQTIRQIIEMPEYYKLFGVKLRDDVNAKDNFETIQGGCMFAAGTGGPITSRGMGLPNNTRFSGCGIIDDIHKPHDVHSDTIRESDNNWFYETFESRLNNPKKTPIIAIGQRLHEGDIFSEIFEKNKWKKLVLESRDAARNALDPSKHTVQMLDEMEKREPYKFAAQMQQNPMPAGGGIFKKDWFAFYQQEPQILLTFLTVDTAETEKNYNDATVFSFWGLYRIQQFGQESNVWGLHWIDCLETWIEPKDLQHTFVQFVTECFHHRIKPTHIGIEAKSTGVTLASIVSQYQGLQVISFKPTIALGTKADKYLSIQSYVSRKLISFPQYAKHTHPCIEHCSKITANDSHRRDDIADTLYYAVKMALIDKVLVAQLTNDNSASNELTVTLAQQLNARNAIKWQDR